MLLTGSLIGVSLPNFLIGIFLILISPSGWAGCPSFGRGDVTKIGLWTTGLLTVTGIESAGPARVHAGPLSRSR